MKKVILKVNIPDEKAKRKAMKAVSTIPGTESISIDKEQKLTVIGDIDAIEVVGKLRKFLYAEIVSVGLKEEKKDDKKDDGKKEDAKKAYEDFMKAYEAYYKHPYPHYHYYPTYYKVVPQDDYQHNCPMC